MCDDEPEEKVYLQCPVCGQVNHSIHMRLVAVCPEHLPRRERDYRIRRAEESEGTKLQELNQAFWNETTIHFCGREWDVAEVPALLAECEGETAGFLSYVEADETIVILSLGVTAQYQRSGIGHALLAAVEDEARARGQRRVVLSTTNDNLPALGFYQRAGYRLVELLAGEEAAHHGKVFTGVCGLPVYDEIRLAKELS